jgi:hypothetical protein
MDCRASLAMTQYQIQLKWADVENNSQGTKMTDLNPDTVEYAGFWIRVGAAIIDSILVMMITYPILYAVYGWAG